MAELLYAHPVARRVRARARRHGILRKVTTQPVNVGAYERLASGVLGGIAIAEGLKRRSAPGLGLAGIGGLFLYRALTGHCGAYQMLGINTAHSEQGPRSSVPAKQGMKVFKAMTINRPREELFQFWHNLENLPRIMRHLESVKRTGEGRSHWVARGPMEKTFEWDAEITNLRDNELIAWRSLEGSEVDTAGSVHFVPAPGKRGTEVRVSLRYNPPGGKIGATIAQLLGQDPDWQIEEDLRHFKQMMEAGEIPTVAGQSSCRRS